MQANLLGRGINQNTGRATVNTTGQAAAELDALLPAILQSSLGFDPTGDRALKGEL